MRRVRLIALLGVLLCGLTAAASAQEPSSGAAQNRGPRLPLDRSQDLSRQESQIRRTRTVTRRILHDRRASDEIKQQATELDALLDQREQVIARLEKQQRDFLAQHKSEIDEIDDLRRRANELDERLSTARKDVLDSSKADIAALRDATTRAADIANGLRERYIQERRHRLQR